MTNPVSDDSLTPRYRVPVKLTTIAAIKRYNGANGYHFFNSRTMDAFGSRVLPYVFPLSDGSALFITSETDELVRPESPNYRRFTVRHAKLDGRIYTVGRYMEHATHTAAIVTATRIARYDKATHDHPPYSDPNPADKTDKENSDA